MRKVVDGGRKPKYIKVFIFLWFVNFTEGMSLVVTESVFQLLSKNRNKNYFVQLSYILS